MKHILDFEMLYFSQYWSTTMSYNTQFNDWKRKTRKSF